MIRPGIAVDRVVKGHPLFGDGGAGLFEVYLFDNRAYLTLEELSRLVALGEAQIRDYLITSVEEFQESTA